MLMLFMAVCMAVIPLFLSISIIPFFVIVFSLCQVRRGCGRRDSSLGRLSLVAAHRSTCSTADGGADDRTILTTHLLSNCGTRRGTRRAANNGISVHRKR